VKYRYILIKEKFRISTFVVCSVNNDQRLTEIWSKKILPSTDPFFVMNS